MLSKISTRQIWGVAYPIILGSIAQNILNVTDTAFLGRLGEVALGGGVIGGLFYHVLLMIGWGTGVGGQIIIARRYGEGAHRTIGRVVEHLFYFLSVISVLLIILVKFNSGHFLGLVVDSPAINGAGKEFVDYRIFGLLFAFVNYSFNSFYVGITKTKVITATTSIMVVVNIVLDYALIFGHWGFPEMGIAGAALASVIAEATSCVVFVLYTRFKFGYGKYNLFNFAPLNRKLLVRILNVAWPLMFQFFLSIFVWFVFFLFIEKMGEVPLAVSNILRSVYIVLMIPIWGFASATNTFVSQLIGQERSGEVMRLVKKVIMLSMSAVFGLGLICISFPTVILRIYTNNPLLIEQSLPVFNIVAIAAIGMAGAFVMFNGVSGTGNTKVSFAIEVGTLLIYILWAYLMAIVFKTSLTWVWAAEIIYGIFITSISYWYLKSNKWIGKKV
ncbi:MAG TPA: MATE family efflux transporter [Tenuifilaceae bacterium]|nr:MATE family efflux transporter [Tenuifilaceae bacterium]HPI45130.1 MATE family efflux transporter [Tenuifilaceae bacterium]